MGHYFEKTLRNGLLVAGLLAASLAVPAWAASGSSGSQAGKKTTSMPATKSQTQMLRGQSKGQTRQPEGKGGKTASMPSSPAQNSQLKEHKNMAHQNGGQGKKWQHGKSQ